MTIKRPAINVAITAEEVRWADADADIDVGDDLAVVIADIDRVQRKLELRVC